MEEQRKQKSERLSTALVNVLDRADVCIGQEVNEIRRLRKQIKDVKKRLADMVKTLEYAKATGNVLPMYGWCQVHEVVRILGIDQFSDPDAFKMPENWEPEKEE